MLSCTFPEIQHCSLHKPSKENPIVTLRQFFQFLHKGIRITRAACDAQLFICLDILECQDRGDKRTLRLVEDYSMPNVAEKVARIILSYTDYVNRVVWKKY